MAALRRSIKDCVKSRDAMVVGWCVVSSLFDCSGQQKRAAACSCPFWRTRMTPPWRLLVGSWGIESCNSGHMWLPFVKHTSSLVVESYIYNDQQQMAVFYYSPEPPGSTEI